MTRRSCRQVPTRRAVRLGPQGGVVLTAGVDSRASVSVTDEAVLTATVD
jgi:hypothetical protein